MVASKLFAYCIFFIATLAPFVCPAQKIRLKPADTKPDCLRDSVNRAAERLRGADIILTFCRYQDTGYYNENTETATMVWRVKGQTYLRQWKRCADAIVPVMTMPPDTLVAFYFQQRLGDLPDQFILRKDAPMAGPGYHIGVYLPGSSTFSHIRAPARHAPPMYLMVPNVPNPASGALAEDARCVWLDLLEKVAP